MDWKYILSLSHDSISEDEKDELYNLIAWFNYDAEKLDSKKYVALLKISQEIMKHKSEQVEALLAELDEIAVQQGEEEARKHESSEDLKTLTSKKASGHEDTDTQKYKEMKVKLRQQIKSNENQEKKIEKLQHQLAVTNEEKLHLQSELNSVLNRADESQSSDISEAVIDKQKELTLMVQGKNKQISQLLTDIENIEADNHHLKKSITDLRDNLEDATEQLTTSTNEYTAIKIKFDDATALITELNEKNEALRSQIEDLVENRKTRDEEIDKFTTAIDTRVGKWKKILETKDHEIDKLKKQVHISSVHSSSESNFSFRGDKSYNEVLNKLLNEREVHIDELKEQLQSATIEMDKSTQVIQQITHEKNSCVQQIEEFTCIITDLKSQLKLAHERCQDYHENVTIAENLAESKEKDIDEIIRKLKSEGKIDLAESWEQNQALKSRTRIQERKISSYVKIINKLQNSVDTLEQENNALREKCEIASDEEVELNGVLLKKSKEKKDLEKLHKQISELEDEKLKLRSKVHDLNRQLSAPSAENIIEKSSEVESPKEVISDTQMNDDVTNTKYVAVLQENDALRKGLQEILECVQTKSQTSRKEIKSDTLEKLLRALDMRHISGWYHPAMRLQAELHTLQGVNMELREQLKNLRSQLNDYMEGGIASQKKYVDETDNRILVKDNYFQKLPDTLNDQEAKDMVNTLTKKLEDYSQNFVIIEEQLNVLYNQYISEKGMWENKEKEYESDKNKLEEKSAVLEAKLHEFSHFSDDEYKTAERFAEMSENIVILNRKCVFLEKQESNLTLEVNKYSNNLKNAEIATSKKINQMSHDIKFLQNELKIKDQISHTLVNRELFIEVQNNFENLMLKYRQLLHSFNGIRTEYSSEFVVLSETAKLLQEQNEELRRTLVNALSNQHKDETVTLSNEFEVLSNKVAQFEVNEIAEKQRADHMNNLYNLVKDQLAKAENRFENLEKYNQELLNKNLMLQEDITKYENKIVDYIDSAEIKNIKLKYEKILNENGKFILENDQLKNEVKVIGMVQSIAPESSNSLQILSLKHQILDLQASSDDKALIARLSTDVIIARLSENQCQKRLDDLEIELKEYQDNCATFSLLLKEEQANKIQVVEQLHSKISILEETIRDIRRRYLGSAPLISQDIFNINLQQILKDKMESFKSLEKIRKTQNNSLILEEELNKKLVLIQDFESNIQHYNEDVSQKIRGWHQEKNSILIKQLRNERELEFKNLQIEQIHYKLNSQDELISQLHEELLKGYNTSNVIPTFDKGVITTVASTQTENDNGIIKSTEKFVTFKETQTNNQLDRSLSNENYDSLFLTNLRLELNNCKDEIKEKDGRLDQLKLKVTDLEMNVSLFRSQIGDKQSQIMFYEKHILELQNKITKLSDDSLRTGQSKALMQCNSEEMIALHESLKKLEESNVQKDEVVLKYQTLLKKDRDEHSLAASRMQQEMLRFQDIIVAQDKAYKELKETSIQHPGKAAIEQYILQVHALEKHTAELHTTVSTLNLQLQSSRQESARWQTLANERLDSMEQLRQDLEEQHQNELFAYKRDSEKWCHEIVKLKEMISQHRSEIITHNDPEIKLKLKEKEDKIHELNVSLRHVKNELRKRSESTEIIASPKLDELELAKEQISKDYESLKKRYEQVINRERSLKEELRTLKEQLLKKPVSARTDRSEKEHFLKKITTLEKEVENLKSKLDTQLAINDSHKVAVTEDFEKWKKQKFLQQTAEKLKIKLQEKEEEFNKLNHSYAGYKILIERLEREKYGLENRIKTLRNTHLSTDIKRLEILNLENEELRHRIDAVNAKLEMQQHHSGGLGAAMLQEKLEAQERKIAILELSAKGGGVEVRGEIERLHSSLENVQKLNLRLEAENLELKFDLAKYKKDFPRLREQVDHLENYIQILKSENESKEAGIQLDDKGNPKQENKKIAELERTVFVLKRVVEKLQIENKRLQGGARLCATTDRMGSTDKIKADFNRLKEQLGERVQQVAHLEDQLKAANSKIISLETQINATDIKGISNELTTVKSDLAYKTQLLDKVKILLHRAAVKEKALSEEVNQLKSGIPKSNNT